MFANSPKINLIMTFTNINTYKKAIILYVFVFSLFTYPFWLCGEVVSPYRQYNHLSLQDDSGSNHIENRKFSDYVKAYVPETKQHLSGLGSSEIKLWTKQNQLGRPLGQGAGIAKSYFLSLGFAALTNNPQIYLTILTLFNCFLAGFFLILFCKEKEISPTAGFIAGSGLGMCSLSIYWLTFPMVTSIWCWGMGALYGMVLIDKKRDLLGWSIVAFSVYSLLLTARMQSVVYIAYILFCCGVFTAYRKWLLDKFDAYKFIMHGISAVAIGVIFASPVYLDLTHAAAESTRASVEYNFFTRGLPNIDSFARGAKFFAAMFAPELYGNPIEPTYPLRFNGFSVNSLVLFFLLISLFVRFKQTWGWWIAISLLLCMAFSTPVHKFAVNNMGFNLSRSSPIGLILFPMSILIAYGADALIKRNGNTTKKFTPLVLVAVFIVFSTLIACLLFGLSQSLNIRWNMFITASFIIILLLVQFKRTYPSLLILATSVVVFAYSFPLMLRQDPNTIPSTSPLVEKIRDNLPGDSRFAFVGDYVQALLPNVNAGVGLSSIHTYNSLSSRKYQKLIKDLGGQVAVYGRYNSTINPDYNGTMFWMSNISLVLSKENVSHSNLEYMGEESGISFNRVIDRMGNSIQVPLSDIVETTSGSLEITDPRLFETHKPSKLVDLSDMLEFKVDSKNPSVFILSQEFHRDWKAAVFNKGKWEPAATIDVNGVFQGILLPSGAERVRLKFNPLVRYMWISHIFWLLLFTGIVINIFRNKRKRACLPV